MQFINTALIPFTLFLFKTNLFPNEEISDMIINIFFIFLGNAFITNFCYFFDVLYFYRLYLRKKIKKDGKKSPMTQFQAN